MAPHPHILQAHYRDHGQLQYARSLLVLHNLVSRVADDVARALLWLACWPALAAGPCRPLPAPHPAAASRRLPPALSRLQAHQGRGPPEEVGMLDLPEAYGPLFK